MKTISVSTHKKEKAYIWRLPSLSLSFSLTECYYWQFFIRNQNVKVPSTMSNITHIISSPLSIRCFSRCILWLIQHIHTQTQNKQAKGDKLDCTFRRATERMNLTFQKSKSYQTNQPNRIKLSFLSLLVYEHMHHGCGKIINIPFGFQKYFRNFGWHACLECFLFLIYFCWCYHRKANNTHSIDFHNFLSCN